MSRDSATSSASVSISIFRPASQTNRIFKRYAERKERQGGTGSRATRCRRRAIGAVTTNALGLLHLCVILLGYVRQALHEGDDVPYLLVLMRGAECWHAGHSDSVLCDPEKFRG